jgi:hypothetical protein
MITIAIQKLKRLPRILFTIFCVLLVCNLLVIFISRVTGHPTIYGLVGLFNFDQESNIPTYFSALDLLVAAGLLYIIYRVKKAKNSTDSKYWLLLLIIFIYLSIDENANIHPLLQRAAKAIFTEHLTFLNWFDFQWVVLGAIIALILGAFLLKFYLQLAKRYKLLFGIAAVLFAGGVLGMEVIGGLFYNPDANSQTVIYRLLATLEESMEMNGVIVFIYSLIDYMQKVLNKADNTDFPVLKIES